MTLHTFDVSCLQLKLFVFVKCSLFLDVAVAKDAFVQYIFKQIIKQRNNRVKKIPSKIGDISIDDDSFGAGIY